MAKKEETCGKRIVIHVEKEVEGGIECHPPISYCVLEPNHDSQCVDESGHSNGQRIKG